MQAAAKAPKPKSRPRTSSHPQAGPPLVRYTELATPSPPSSPRRKHAQAATHVGARQSRARAGDVSGGMCVCIGVSAPGSECAGGGFGVLCWFSGPVFDLPADSAVLPASPPLPLQPTPMQPRDTCHPPCTYSHLASPGSLVPALQDGTCSSSALWGGPLSRRAATLSPQSSSEHDRG